jgi:hypothetical protein
VEDEAVAEAERLGRDGDAAGNGQVTQSVTSGEVEQ